MSAIYNSTYNSKDNLHSMIRVLTKQKIGLKIAHINAQSIKNKIDEFRHIFSNSGADIVCVSETWFRPELQDLLFSLNGFKLFRADRLGHAGGVAMYIRKDISCKLVRKSDHDSEIEFIFMEIFSGSRKLLIGTVYRPNNRTDYNFLMEIVDELSLQYNDIIICGDFNSNVLRENRLKSEFLSFGLKLANDTVPTHYTSTGDSLIDLVFVSCRQKVLLYDQLSAPVFSKHDLCFLIFDFYIDTTFDLFCFRDFRSINFQSLHQDINLTMWNDIFYMLDIDEQVAFLTDHINFFYNKYVPIKTKTLNRDQNPWFDAEIRYLICLRNIAYGRWKRFKTPELHGLYKSARNKVNSTINYKKRSYYTQKFDRALTTKETWKNIRCIGIGKDASSDNNDLDVDILNSKFVNINMVTPDPGFYSEVIDLHEPFFYFNSVTNSEVLESIMSIKSNAVGLDGVDPRFLRIIIQFILPHITHIFNAIILKAHFPDSWKHAKIIPLSKGRGEYRPIAILPFLSKAFEKLINKQIRKHLEDNSLLTNMQSGFRPEHSCTTTLQKVTEDLRNDLDNNLISILVLLDHSKAFDTVDQQVLVSKLTRFFYFSSNACDLMRSYLTCRCQSVSISSRYSNPLALTRGVPQGSILGPLLYSMYSNDLPQQLQHCSVHMYADDVQLYISTSREELANCVSLLNMDLTRVSTWAESNGLSLNPVKSKCLILSRAPFTLPNDMSVKLSNVSINIVQTAKNLGVIFNNKLTWRDHIMSAVGSTNAALRNLYISQSFTPLRIRMMLAKTYIVPKLLYACELFSNCSRDMMNKLNVTFNNIVRYIFVKRRGDHISELAKSVYGVTFTNLLNMRTVISLHKIITTKTPSYLYAYIRFARSPRGNKLIHVRHRTSFSEHFFFIHAIRLWNKLPFNVQIITNSTQFKTNLLKHFQQTTSD